MYWDDLPKRCRKCIHLKIWDLKMDGNHGCYCRLPLHKIIDGCNDFMPMQSDETLISFTPDDAKMIQQYMELIEAVDMRTAIMNAISLALDNPAPNA